MTPAETKCFHKVLSAWHLPIATDWVNTYTHTADGGDPQGQATWPYNWPILRTAPDLGWAESSEAKLRCRCSPVVDAVHQLVEDSGIPIHERDVRHILAAIGLDADQGHVQAEDEIHVVLAEIDLDMTAGFPPCLAITCTHFFTATYGDAAVDMATT